MNFNFDLRQIDNFNSDILSEDFKKNILNIFNFNKYKYVLTILKDINVDEKSKELLVKEKTKILEQANINFIINNIKHPDKLIIGSKFYLYKKSNTYYTTLVKENCYDKDYLEIDGENENYTILDSKDYLGCFELKNDLTWEKNDE